MSPRASAATSGCFLRAVFAAERVRPVCFAGTSAPSRSATLQTWGPRASHTRLFAILRPVIEAHHLSKAYRPGVFALRDLSFTVEKGEFVFLTGPSGAGKSTLFKLLLRAEVPTSGDVIVNGRNLARLTNPQIQSYRRTIGFVFQDFKLIPRKSVFDNVALVPRLMGSGETQLKRRVTQALNEVGLTERLKAYPLELSGGEQQRVAIARALVSEPQLFLADEPTGNLDPVLSLEVMTLFRAINARGTTVLIATHDRALIRHLGKRVIALDHGQMVESA
jgi:cell division transport system ATP-binding protein